MAESDPRHLTRRDFSVMRTLPTRWKDNDSYGHLNNVVHYELFDTALNAWLIEELGEAVLSEAIGVVAESGCRYFAELSFPHAVDIAYRVARVGRTSVRYEFALFEHGSSIDTSPAAFGTWVHVYISPTSRKPVPLPQPLHDVLIATFDHQHSQSDHK